MSILKYPLKAVDGLMDRVCAVVGAIMMSQIPGFISHYVQRLGGHVDEAKRNVAGWQEIANKTTDGSIGKLVSRYQSSDMAETVEAGQKCLADIDRLENLQDALVAITDASAWSRPFAFLGHIDLSVGRSALGSYTPNVPVDLPGLVYAAIGLVLAVLIYHGIKLAFRAAANRKRGQESEGDEITDEDEVYKDEEL
jgi:hypothetical protein